MARLLGNILFHFGIIDKNQLTSGAFFLNHPVSFTNELSAMRTSNRIKFQFQITAPHYPLKLETAHGLIFPRGIPLLPHSRTRYHNAV